MKNLTSLVIMLAVVVSGGISVLGQTADAVAQRRAEASAAMAKVKFLSPEQAKFYSARAEKASRPASQDSTGTPPSMLFMTFGNLNAGMSVYAYNAQALMEGTVMIAQKVVGENVIIMGAVGFGGDVPPGMFRYPFEEARRSTYTEIPGMVRYEIIVFYPDGTGTYSSLEKPVNKYWPGMFNPVKLVNQGVYKLNRGRAVVELQGIITNSPTVSVMGGDPDVDYSLLALPYRMAGNKLVVDVSSLQIPEGGEFTILVGNSFGQTDQISVRVPITSTWR